MLINLSYVIHVTHIDFIHINNLYTFLRHLDRKRWWYTFKGLAFGLIFAQEHTFEC